MNIINKSLVFAFTITLLTTSCNMGRSNDLQRPRTAPKHSHNAKQPLKNPNAVENVGITAPGAVVIHNGPDNKIAWKLYTKTIDISLRNNKIIGNTKGVTGTFYNKGIAKMKMRADTASGDNINNIITVQGNVVVDYVNPKGNRIKADKVTYYADPTKHYGIAEGNVVFYSKDTQIRTGVLYFDTKNDKIWTNRGKGVSRMKR